jgi:hypothetical protein
VGTFEKTKPISGRRPEIRSTKPEILNKKTIRQNVIVQNKPNFQCAADCARQFEKTKPIFQRAKVAKVHRHKVQSNTDGRCNVSSFEDYSYGSPSQAATKTKPTRQDDRRTSSLEDESCLFVFPPKGRRIFDIRGYFEKTKPILHGAAA